MLAVGALLTALWVPAVPAQEAEARLRQSVSQQPNSADPHLQLANFLLDNLRREWSQRDPNASGEDFKRQADEFQGKAQELVNLYEKVIALDPKNVDARVNLAEVNFVFFSQFDQAEQLLKQALEQNPDSIKAMIARAEFLFFFKAQRANALAELEQALAARPGHADLSITLADLLTGGSLQAADFDKARKVLNDALVQNPGHEGLNYMLASVWYRDASLTQPINAAKAQTALDLYLAQINAKPELDLVIEVAQLAQALGKLEQARDIVATGLTRYPDEPQLKLLQGDLWLAEGSAALDQGQIPPQAVQAETEYRSLLKPETLSRLTVAQQVQLYYNLGVLAQYRGQAAKAQPPQALAQYQEAERMFRQAMDIFDRINIVNRPLQQELAKTLESMGQIHFGQSQTPQAAEYYKQACSLQLESSCGWLKQQGMAQ